MRLCPIRSVKERKALVLVRVRVARSMGDRKGCSGIGQGGCRNLGLSRRSSWGGLIDSISKQPKSIACENDVHLPP
jgi:hypothetical protein